MLYSCVFLQEIQQVSGLGFKGLGLSLGRGV